MAGGARTAKQTLAISPVSGYLIRMLGWSINLFRIRGIQLTLHFSFVLLLAYAAMEGYEEAGPAGIFWSTALLIAFFTCVVLHELGHSFTARRFGVGVRRILLMPIGGMAEFDSIPRQPGREFLITVAGPAVNFAIAAVLWFAMDSSAELPGTALPASLAEFGWVLLTWNIYMGIFNLVPVFPMDGGRILRALLATRLPYVRATFWAATIAKVLAVIGMIAGFWMRQYLLVALFAFIFFAGEAEYRSLLRREREDAYWREMMTQFHALHRQPATEREPPLLEP
jgi:Zn-dependent protease